MRISDRDREHEREMEKKLQEKDQAIAALREAHDRQIQELNRQHSEQIALLRDQLSNSDSMKGKTIEIMRAELEKLRAQIAAQNVKVKKNVHFKISFMKSFVASSLMHFLLLSFIIFLLFIFSFLIGESRFTASRSSSSFWQTCRANARQNRQTSECKEATERQSSGRHRPSESTSIASLVTCRMLRPHRTASETPAPCQRRD